MIRTSPKIAFGTAALLGVTLLTGTLSQRLSPHPLPRVHTSGELLQTKVEASGFTRLTPEDTRKRHQAGAHLFLDARNLSDYLQGHIPGAFPVPVNDFDTYFPEIAPILLPDSPLIVYCGNPACDQALRLAERLRDAGYTDISLFPAGYEAWSSPRSPEAAP